MEESWSVLPPELLARIFHTQADLSIRLVCTSWARGCSTLINKLRVSSPPWRRKITRDELARLAAFENLKTLRLDFRGASDMLLALPSMPRLHFSTPIRSLASLANLANWMPALVTLHLSVSSAIRAGVIFGQLAQQLPRLEQLTLICEDPEGNPDDAEWEGGLDLDVAGMDDSPLRSLSIQGRMGLGEGDIEALALLSSLCDLDAQLSSADAYWALVELTQISRLAVRDWNPGPPPCNSVLVLEQFSMLASLRSLFVTHTFGLSERIVLDGLYTLTQLEQLELRISSGVEAFVQDIRGLSMLSAQCALHLPFDPGLDLRDLTNLTRLQLQEMMPFVREFGEVAIDRPAILLTHMAGLTGLRELKIQDGADAIDSRTVASLLVLSRLTTLHFAREFGAAEWSARAPLEWTNILSQLTGLQELGIDGCATLTLLNVATLGRLSKLLLHNCCQVTLIGMSALTNLRVLSLGDSPLAGQRAMDALPALGQLRNLDLTACPIGIDTDVSLLCAATNLTSLHLGQTLVSPAGLRNLEQLPYLRRLVHTLY